MQDEGYAQVKPDADGILRSEVLPGLWLESDRFWAGELAAVLATLQRGLASAEHARFVADLRSAAA